MSNEIVRECARLLDKKLQGELSLKEFQEAMRELNKDFQAKARHGYIDKKRMASGETEEELP